MISNCFKIETRVFFLALFLLCLNIKVHGESDKSNSIETFQSSELLTKKISAYSDLQQRPNPLLQIIKIKQKKNKKVIAAILAFPFPFGMVGLHRIYLGTSPHVPVVYIGTLGGVFGILPFIDFCVIVLDKDLDRYIENKNVLMWVDENKRETK